MKNPMLFPRLEEKKLFIFIDSYSIDKKLKSSDKWNLDRFARYFETQIFEFGRTSYETKYDSLKQVTKFRQKHEKRDEFHDILIEYCKDEYEGEYMLGYNSKTVEMIAQEIFGKYPKSQDVDSLTWLFANNDWCLFNRNSKIVFVTFNNTLLMRNTTVSKNLNKNLFVVNLFDSMHIMDLFAKSQHGNYFIDSNFLTHPGMWYWYSFRSKVPRYNVPSRRTESEKHILEEFANRFTYLLCSLDNLGFQYYFPSDSHFFVPFNFNYFILLTTGIFDCLAIESKEKYNLKFDYDIIPSKTSLYSKLGKEFLQELEKVNSQLRKHIIKYSNFIYLIYSLREYAIHREGFRIMSPFQTRYNTRRTSSLDSDSFTVTEDVVNAIRGTGYKNSPNEINQWGISYSEPFIFLQPYKFCKTLAILLIEFSDRYLDLLGFPDFLQTPSGKEMKNFKQSRVGF